MVVKKQLTNLNAKPINFALDPVFSFVNKWAVENRSCDTFVDDGDIVIWCNDYVDYTLRYDEMRGHMLTCENVELYRIRMFHVPVGETEAFFLNLMQMLNHK